MGEFLTVEEVAKMFRVTDRTIFRYIKKGKILAQKIPGTKQWLINSDELKKIFEPKQQKAIK